MGKVGQAVWRPGRLAAAALGAALLAGQAQGRRGEAEVSPPPPVDQPLAAGGQATGDAALVFGIDDYVNLPDVPYARRDAEVFSNYLVQTRGMAASNVLWLRGGGRDQVLTTLDVVISRVQPGGTLWLYFAGNAAPARTTGDRLLLTADAPGSRTNLEDHAISLAEVQKRLYKAGIQGIAVVDAGMSGVSRNGEPLFKATDALASARAMEEMRNLAVWSAAGTDEVAGALDASGHGLFTYFLLGAGRGWADGALDGTRDGLVLADEVAAYVERMVGVASGGQQGPRFGMSPQTRGLVMGPATTEDAPDPALFEPARGGRGR